MCGIVGFAGHSEAAPVLLDGLARLEYRGYDSAGVVVCDGKDLNVVKTKGYVEELSKLTDGGKTLPGTVGIGHTRWATHGQPTDTNAHPHLSFHGSLAVVHNGIIENYAKLREFLIGKGYAFKSETDTEVAANMIDYYYDDDILKAVAEATRRMEGSYALGIVCKDVPDAVIATRKESPLVLGIGDGCNLLASDVAALLRYTRNVIYLEDGEIAEIKADSVQLYSAELERIEKPVSTVDWDVSAAEKGGYEHFMLKEIMEQPDAVRKTISPRLKDGRVVLDGIRLTPEYVKNLHKIYIVACGSSYHVGMVAKYNMEKLVRKPVEVALASEFRYCDPLVDENTLVICISQSGTTADTIAALRQAKKLGARILSIVNVVGSVIAEESDDVLYTWAGPEIAVATTKAYSTQLAVTYLLTLYMAEICGTVTPEKYDWAVRELEALPEKLAKLLDNVDQIQYLASIYFNKEDIFFIGRNIDYALSLEGSLKLKEISYIHSEAYAAGELKHGTISLIEPGRLVISVASYTPLVPKTVSNIVEVKTRGAEILSITTEENAADLAKVSDNMIVIPDAMDLFLPSLAIVPMQLFAYYVSLMRGCSIDKPRNLAKSVTVE
ncbi:MAG: glutamine--fructose-6-phosphate transaminase (isomerizing) [Oscillospiraceae bacterium]|nr:glutamine--fructose-6-phosphate transaminase (isomerizing) [Oscillospiraceae bacterium]